jgi:hypothetical protein
MLVGCSGAPDMGTPEESSDESQAWKTHGGVQSRETIIVEWNETTLAAIRATGVGSTIAARALAEVHTATYDAWAAYTDKALPSQATAPARRPAKERKDDNKRTAISYAAYRVLVDLFPTELARFDKRLTQFGGNPNDKTVDPKTPVGVGNAAAAAVIAVRHADASNQLGDITPGAYSDYTGYSPVNTPDLVNDPSRWQPLRVNGKDQAFLTPQWQNVIAFALPDPSAFRPAPPAMFGTSDYESQAKEIINLSAHLNDRRKVIAEYWAEGPGSFQAPGHWSELAQRVSIKQRNSIDDDAKLFFALSNALLDTSIAVWESKRFYDSERPITAIRTLFAGKTIQAWGGPFKGTASIDGAKFQPYERLDVVTPPSPEHVAEESAFAFAAAEVLRQFTGSDRFGEAHVTERGDSLIEPGKTPRRDVKLCWRTFTEAARQASRATQLRGVNFEQGDLAGRAMGTAVAQQSFKAAQKLFGATHENCGHPRDQHGECECSDRDDD